MARHILDQAFYEFRRQLTYKAEQYGSQVVVADRFFTSSKRCYPCHVVNPELILSDREWQCVCGIVHDRKLNAAINLEQLAMSTVSFTIIDACREGSTGLLSVSTSETTLRRNNNLIPIPSFN